MSILGSTQAIALAFDMIQVGRAERMIVIAGDNASSDTLMPWIGNGFRALGAATIASEVSCSTIQIHCVTSYFSYLFLAISSSYAL